MLGAEPRRAWQRAERRERGHHDREQRQARDGLDHAGDRRARATRARGWRVTQIPSGRLIAVPSSSATSVSWRCAVR